MRISTATTTLYSLDELSDAAQQTALERLYDINVDGTFWHEYMIDDAKTIGALLGIDIDDVYFSGFSSQGDGACFTGSYAYRKNAARAVREYAPQDTELHAIADALQEVQRVNFYNLSASVKHSGRYCHELCTDVTVYDDRYAYGDVRAGAAERLTECLRDYMRWIYRRLESEYEYLTSKESIRETILANDYEFTEDGRLF